jgi:type IV secretion system protein VirB9
LRAAATSGLSLLLILLSVVAAYARDDGAVRAPDGAYRFVYGTGIPTIQIGVGDACDIEFEPHETIQRVFLSDSLRWKLASGVSGRENVPHLLVKPTRDRLVALLTVLTDRRAYHIRLVSTQKPQAEYVGFVYSSASASRTSQSGASDGPDAADGKVLTCAGFHAAYVASGAVTFRDAKVCNNGAQTYVAAGIWAGDLPMPYVLDNGVDEIANYSYDPVHRVFTLDGVPTRFALVRGSGRRQLRTIFELRSQ